MATTEMVTVADGQESCTHQIMHGLSGLDCVACSRLITSGGRVLITGDSVCPHTEMRPAVLHECTRSVGFTPEPTEETPEPETVYALCGRLVWEIEVPDDE